MKKHDGRKLDPKTMEEIRTRAVQCIQDGESPEVVIKALGFCRACIYNWLARYRSGGWHALKTGKEVDVQKNLTEARLHGYTERFGITIRSN
jgi:transposase